MSRSGYSDECEQWELIRWRGAVKSAIRGKRGQAMLRELVQALDALPEKRLAQDSLVNADGQYCALGALGRARGLMLEQQDPEDVDPDVVARTFGIPAALAAEVMYLNDERAASDCKWVHVEICGPMRTHHPDWGSHTRSITVQNMQSAEERWTYMRAWAVGNLSAEPRNDGTSGIKP